MDLREAVAQRILQFCKDRKLSVNALANISVLTQSTLNNIVNGYTNDVKLSTIIHICEGLEISLSEFFDSKLFKNLDINL